VSESHAEPDPADEAPHAEERQPAPRALPKRLTFRITRVTVLVVITIALCVTPLAWAGPWLLLTYLIPLLLLAGILRLRTVVDAEGITARSVLGSTRFGWDEVRSFHLDERHWVRAVLGSGKEVRLPSVRVRDLPHLAAMSGGRLDDPAAEIEDAGGSDSSGEDSAAGSEDAVDSAGENAGEPSATTETGTAAPNKQDSAAEDERSE
jgi:hypothetical protein